MYSSTQRFDDVGLYITLGSSSHDSLPFQSNNLLYGAAAVYVSGYVAPTPAPKPTRSSAELAFAAAVKANSSVYHPATPCQPNSDGATR